jgi:hypothetical protein
MNTLFEPAGCDAILQRIQSVSADSTALWGKMNVAQMFAHCQRPLMVATGEMKLRRGLIGIMFGGFAKKQLARPEPFKRGLPTAPEFVVREPGSFAVEKARLSALVQRFGSGGPSALPQEPHPFFGRLTSHEWDLLQWKHLDHHLRQFRA